jgi:hypothetical protein
MKPGCDFAQHYLSTAHIPNLRLCPANPNPSKFIILQKLDHEIEIIPRNENQLTEAETRSRNGKHISN